MTTLISFPHLVQRFADEYEEDNPQAVAKLNGRFKRGIQYAKEGRVQPTEDPHIFNVQASGENTYTVNTIAKSCNCPDAAKKNVCKHRIAVHYWKLAMEEMQAPKALEHDPLDNIVSKDAPNVVVLPTPFALCDQIAQAVHETRRNVFQNNTPALTYGVVSFGGDEIPVEIIGMLKSVAYVQALPSFDEHGHLSANFPFPSPFGNSVPYSTTELPTSSLRYLNVIREDNTMLYGA